MFTGNPVSIIVNRHICFLTQSRKVGMLHNFFQCCCLRCTREAASGVRDRKAIQGYSGS